ncbi:MAG: hypothetical protein IH892_07295 [Planctomycetes bacterium]|nr:hypothetical protein [Planctomycetota bacterium]
MSAEHSAFFEAVINAGAILAGFSGTFLVFRIQREANYYRQPALSFEHQDAVDVYIGLMHFTSSFLLIILTSISSIFFGYLIPLFALAGTSGGLFTPRVVVGGMVGTHGGGAQPEVPVQVIRNRRTMTRNNRERSDGRGNADEVTPGPFWLGVSLLGLVYHRWPQAWFKSGVVAAFLIPRSLDLRAFIRA